MSRLAAVGRQRLAALGRERLAAGVLVIGAVVFTATGVIRLLREGGIEVLTLPLALLAADLVIAGDRKSVV